MAKAPTFQNTEVINSPRTTCMAQETADSLRKEAEALGGAQRSTDSGLKKEGESTTSKDLEQDIDSKDVPVEEKELDKEAEEDEEKLDDGESDELDSDEDEEEDSEEEDDESEDDEKDKNRRTEDNPQDKRERKGDDSNARRRLERREKNQSELQVLREKVQQFEAAESAREQERIKGEIAELASELKSDPAGLEKVINLAVKIAERRIGERLPSKEVLSSITSKAQTSKFDNEFNSTPVQDYITDTYPRATAKQLSDARTLLKKLSKDSSYPLDYFLLKNKKDFDAILDVRRRRGLESARRHGTDTEITEHDTDSAKGIEDLDEKYRNASSGSGLRRERASEKTF